MINKADIELAHERIRPFIRRTPVLNSTELDELTSSRILFKCENLQFIGAFKARGAMNAALSLTKEELHKGLATHSSGNHAQAVARAAKLLGVKAYIVMPHTSAVIKKRGVKELSGEIIECNPTLAEREATLKDVIGQTGATEIHPFNNYDVIAGQATAAKELIEEHSDIDYIIAPVGGGGLLSGSSLAASFFGNNVKVIGAEPSGADDAYRALKSGKIETSQAKSIADGLLTSLGNKTFPIIQEKVYDIVTVTDLEIITAMRMLWERLKMVVEPSAAVPFAALLKNKKPFPGKKVGVIISGGNVDMETALNLFLKGIE